MLDEAAGGSRQEAKAVAKQEAAQQVLRRQNQRLKAALAEKTLEVDFFKGALQQIAARRQPNNAAGETASTPKSRR